MKILVLSDTHGMLRYAENVLDKFSSDIDGFIHLGDYTDDALTLRKKYNKGCFWMVKGNCDFTSHPLFLRANVGGHNIYICHGHREDVKYDNLRLAYRAMEDDCDIALYGHTHCPDIGFYEGVKIFNPGSISLPRQSRVKTFGLLNIDDTGVTMLVYGIFDNEYKIIMKGQY